MSISKTELSDGSKGICISKVAPSSSVLSKSEALLSILNPVPTLNQMAPEISA